MSVSYLDYRLRLDLQHHVKSIRQSGSDDKTARATHFAIRPFSLFYFLSSLSHTTSAKWDCGLKARETLNLNKSIDSAFELEQEMGKKVDRFIKGHKISRYFPHPIAFEKDSLIDLIQSTRKWILVWVE